VSIATGVAMLPGRTLRAIVLVDKRGERSIVSDRRSLPADPAVPYRSIRSAMSGGAGRHAMAGGRRVVLDRARAAAGSRLSSMPMAARRRIMSA
jgi:sulfofructose kinase